MRSMLSHVHLHAACLTCDTTLTDNLPLALGVPHKASLSFREDDRKGRVIVGTELVLFTDYLHIQEHAMRSHDPLDTSFRHFRDRFQHVERGG